MSSGQHKQLLLDAASNKNDLAYEKTIATLSSSAVLKHQGEITLKDVVTDPQEVLALFASKKQQEKGERRERYNFPPYGSGSLFVSQFIFLSPH